MPTSGAKYSFTEKNIDRKISLSRLRLEEAVSALLKVKPEPKGKSKAQSNKARNKK